MRTSISKAIFDEYRDHDEDLGLDDMKSIIRICFAVTGLNWNERDFSDIMQDLLYRFGVNDRGTPEYFRRFEDSPIEESAIKAGTLAEQAGQKVIRYYTDVTMEDSANPRRIGDKLYDCFDYDKAYDDNPEIIQLDEFNVLEDVTDYYEKEEHWFDKDYWR